MPAASSPANRANVGGAAGSGGLATKQWNAAIEPPRTEEEEEGGGACACDDDAAEASALLSLRETRFFLLSLYRVRTPRAGRGQPSNRLF